MSGPDNKTLLLILCGLIGSLSVLSQSPDYPFEIPQYDFIHYDSNQLEFPGGNNSWVDFMDNFSSLVKTGNGQLSIVHIGGSHLQADIYSDRIRQRLQSFQPGSNAGRGMVFPYTIARTNNPSNFWVAYRGRWTYCKNTQDNRSCELGLTGIAVSTFDTTASVSIGFPESNLIHYDFNRVKLFFLDDSSSYQCRIETGCTIRDTLRDDPGTVTWLLDEYVDELRITFHKTSLSQEKFTLFGISLETEDPGLVYHSIGVNGAKIPSFLRCSLMPEHLSILDPNLVILSLGTNDAYTRYFNSLNYKQNYDSLISRIKSAVPDASIILTVPNDSYLYRRYINKNTEKVRDIIIELAEEYNCGVWDFYTIMGGLNSIIVWQRFGLAKRDRIHFTRKGYLLKGDLFFNAFLKSYDDYIESSNKVKIQQ
ncbi:GDSL-type esterase/lipase family protein [Bacteroidota bacterium]